MSSIQHHRVRCTVAALTAAALSVVLVGAPPVNAADLGTRPEVERVRHLQLGPFQKLQWTPVRGAREYQIFVKQAQYDDGLPREWRLLKTVQGTSTRVFVEAGRTRQFGVRAVGPPDGIRHAVTRMSSFGTATRPAPIADLVRVKRWREVRRDAFYRDVALHTSRRGARLVLPDVRGITSVRLVAPTGPRFGAIDVYVGNQHVRRVDLGSYSPDPRRSIRIRVRPSRGGAITLVTRESEPVRISAISHTRGTTTATKTPAAPFVNPPARSFTFQGSGWGHGVGLSQYGAKAMADAGKSVRQILRHYYRGTRTAQASDDRELDVNIGYQTTSVTARLRGLGDEARVKICALTRTGCTAETTMYDRTAGEGTAGRITVIRHDGRVRARVDFPNGDVKRLTGNRIRLRWSGTRYVRGGPSVIRLGNGREYRHGQISIEGYGASLLNTNVRMKLQSEYLRGVAEVPSSWNSKALRAQAIIARTYALKTGAGRKSDCGCHLRDSVVHQAYVGWGKESEGRNAYYGKRWVEAVNMTDGRVLTYNGSLASTYYYSSSGGHTLNSQDVWSGNVPYLQSVEDAWSLTEANPNRRWSATWSQASMASLFGLKNIHKVSVVRRYDGGAVRSLRATASNGDRRTIGGKADYMRSLLGLKSAWIRSIDEAY